MPQSETIIRPVEPRDIDSLYAISLATGDAGRDAAHLYRDGRMLGHIYSAPYAVLSPETALVAEDAHGVAGYIVGTHDTAAFEKRLEQEWWPHLRAAYPCPDGDPLAWDADQRRGFMLHHPKSAPPDMVSLFPAHIHMNFLPRLQGRGTGSALLVAWLDQARAAGVRGIHLGANAANEAGMRFWASRGFQRLGLPLIPADERTAWFAQYI